MIDVCVAGLSGAGPETRNVICGWRDKVTLIGDEDDSKCHVITRTAGVA